VTPSQDEAGAEGGEPESNATKMVGLRHLCEQSSLLGRVMKPPYTCRWGQFLAFTHLGGAFRGAEDAAPCSAPGPARVMHPRSSRVRIVGCTLAGSTSIFTCLVCLGRCHDLWKWVP
jgi:hypothetical protein